MSSSSLQRSYVRWPLVSLVLLLVHGGGVVAGGKVPAIIVFGDSSVDTGNNNFIPTIARSNFWPYGRDYGGGLPTGRFSNGRLATDFISEAFGLPPSIPAYLDSNFTIHQLASGVSFASAATGLDNSTAAVLSVITVSEQLEYFKEYTERLRAAKGSAAAAEIVGDALYIWSIGTNDFIENYYNDMSSRRAQYTVGGYEAYLLGLAEAAIRRVHALGGRKMDFTGLTPMGCLPAERLANRANPGECNEQYNAVARTFNAKLQVLVDKLNKELPGLQLVFADTYTLLADVVNNPAKYGFDNAVQGCCGTGLFEAGYFCSLSTSMLCTNANKYVFFDAIHPTEKMYKLLADTVINTTLHVFM
ncbi:hypothetical protein ACP4OV_031171 [Aristida adscensionis]